MANFRISDLTAVSAYADAQEFEVNDSGTSKKITGTQLKAGVLTNPTVTGTVTADGLTVGDVSYAGNAIIKTQVEGSDAGNYDSGLQMRSHNNDFGGTIALESRSGINDVVAFKYHNNSTAGVRAMAIDATNGDISFYEDTGTTPKFFWDASAERLGIGTSSPSYPLDVSSSSGSGTTLRLHNNGNGGSTNGVVTAFSADSNGSRVGFGNNAFPSAQYSFDVSRIDTSKSGWAWSSYALNSTYQSQSAMTLQYVDASGSQAERLRIDSSGNVGIGTTSPSSKLHVNGDSTFGGAITEGVYNLTGTALDPSNGTIQTKTLSANTTFTDSLSAGESITLMIDDGSASTVTWPTMTWVNNGGAAPTLATSGYTVVALWKVSTTLYGALVGDGS